ncbi:hypothetical protein SAMN05880592_11473 [Bosea sp. TND4EK4]|nr:hypothetical protein SAMN05880592_11473 [Bosea sp. TND4EK4]
MILPFLSITPAAPTKPPDLGGVDARPEDIPMKPHPFHSRRTDAR